MSAAERLVAWQELLCLTCSIAARTEISYLDCPASREIELKLHFQGVGLSGKQVLFIRELKALAAGGVVSVCSIVPIITLPGTQVDVKMMCSARSAARDARLLE